MCYEIVDAGSNVRFGEDGSIVRQNMARRSYRPAIGEIAKSLLVLSGRQPGVVLSALGTKNCIDGALGTYGALRSGPRIEEELKGLARGKIWQMFIPTVRVRDEHCELLHLQDGWSGK